MAFTSSIAKRARTVESLSDEERQLIRYELQSTVSSRYFKQSKRYPEFLTYVVEHALERVPNGIKERTIGIEVFGRPADYDTNTDPIVRNTASEVRKRLALYCADSNPKQSGVWIALEPGNYVPVFYFEDIHSGGIETKPLKVIQDLSTSSASNTDFETELSNQTIASVSSFRKHRKLVIVSLAIAVLSTGISFLRMKADISIPRLNRSIPAVTFLDSLVACVICNSKPVQVIIPASSTIVPSAPAGWNEHYPDVVLEDAKAAMRVAGALQINKLQYQVRLASTSTLSDLAETPDVLIGSTSNRWTMMTLQGLRYHFVEADHKLFVEDIANRSHAPCVLAHSDLDPSAIVDCAILARFYSPLTLSMVVVIAGADRSGTEVAGNLITNPEFSERLVNSLPLNWQNKNVEILLKVTAVDGRPSAPTILSVHTW